MRRQSNSAKPTSSRPELFLTLEAYRRHTRYPYHLRIAVMSRCALPNAAVTFASCKGQAT